MIHRFIAAVACVRNDYGLVFNPQRRPEMTATHRTMMRATQAYETQAFANDITA
jgi:hypothetical protein